MATILPFAQILIAMLTMQTAEMDSLNENDATTTIKKNVLCIYM